MPESERSARALGPPTSRSRLADPRSRRHEPVYAVWPSAYRDAEGPGPLLVRAELRGEALEVEVRDHGIGMRPRVDSPGLGLGLPLIGTLASSVEVDTDDDRQTCVRMRFHGSDTPSSFF